MSQISVSNLTFAYDGSHDNIFENASFQIDSDWKLGFTGRNGRGKSTFLKLLMGKYEYKGKISASVIFQYFPYEIADMGMNTAALVREICPDYTEWELSRELSLLDVAEETLNRPFGTLSNGERTKIMLAALFLGDNHFLLIDEPTNHLDIAGREIVSRYLNEKAGFILVSHDRAFLDACVDHILSINKANIDVVRGNFSSWYENKERQDAFELSQNTRLKKDIKRLEQAARQSGEWADKVEATKIGKNKKPDEHREYVAEQSRRMQRRRKNLEHRQQAAIEEKSGLLKNVEQSDSLKLFKQPYHKTRYLTLTNLSIAYGEKTVLTDFNLSIEAGDRIALQGKNGSGKSSILKLICGEHIPRRGDVSIGSGLNISYVSQDTSGLSGNLADYARQCGIDESIFKALLRKLDFSRLQFEKDMQDFSEGQKKKTLLAKSLCEKAHLLVWDEPLNYVDVLSRIQIEDLLLAYEPTILFVEHDWIFCERVATRMVGI